MTVHFKLKMDLYTEALVSDNIQDIEFEVTIHNEKEFFEKINEIMKMFIKV